MRRPSKRQVGFSLVELLVVIAIIGAIVALLLPAVQAAREATRRSACQNNLRQIGMSLLNYEQQHKTLPIGCLDKRIPGREPLGRQFSWVAAVLPYLEQTPLYERINFSLPYDDPQNNAAAQTILPVYLCPSTSRWAKYRSDAWVGAPDGSQGLAASDYGGIYGAAYVSPSANGVLLYDRAVALKQITDGTSNTLLIAEDTGRDWIMDGEWINGENIFDQFGPINAQQHNEIWSDHPRGALSVFCDGSIHFIDEEIPVKTLRALCTRSAEEVLPNQSDN